MANTTETSLAESFVPAIQALRDMEALLVRIGDADLHRAHPDGGWTCAQLVSHIHLSGLLWIAAMERIRHQPAMFMFREEVGHDALGAPPHSTTEAAGRIAAVRSALDRCVPAADPRIAEHQLEVPPFGTLTVGQWCPLIAGHITGHCAQIREILQVRGLLPA